MSFRSSAQAEDFDLLAREDVRYMLSSRISQASWEVRRLSHFRSSLDGRHADRRPISSKWAYPDSISAAQFWSPGPASQQAWTNILFVSRHLGPQS